MSMYESGNRINQELRNLFSSIEITQFTKQQRSEILNIMLRFGAVAKFRCRSNIAYDNFVNCCLKEIAETKRVKANEESDYEVLRAEVI